jgi:RHS repeat-associated protein
MTTKPSPRVDTLEAMAETPPATAPPKARRRVPRPYAGSDALKWLLMFLLGCFWGPLNPTRVHALKCNLCTTNAINDDLDDADQDEDDDPCDPPASNDGPEGTNDCGMAYWRVSEPYINLWIHDTPLRYRMASGRWRSLTLSYKQRSGIRDTNYAGFGPNWECNWIGLLWVTNNAPPVRYFLPGGGSRVFLGDGALDYKTAQKIYWDLYMFYGPIAAQKYYELVVAHAYYSGVNYQFMSRRLDRYGRTTYFYWTNRTDLAHPFVQLTNVVDRERRSCSIAYTNTSFPSYITSVTDPYGRMARFKYNEKGWLTNITDTAGMSSSFQYDENDVITNLHTPYGNTGFRHFSGQVGEYLLNRAIEITEANGDQQLYTYRDCGLIGGGSAGGDYACDDDTTAYRNSYHWDRMQFAALSDAAKTNYLDMPVTDYWNASLKHWMRQETGSKLLSDTPSATAGPVLHTEVDTNRSAQVFFQWQGWTTPGYIGTLKRVTNIVWNGTSYVRGTSKATEITRNDWGRPTGIVRHYNDTTVTTTGAFDADGRRLQSATGRRGEPVRGYGYHPVITNLLTSVTNALGDMLRYMHDTNGMEVTSITYPSGLVTSNFYYTTGPTGFLAQTVDVGFRTNSFGYANGNVTTHTNELGLVTTSTWDNLNRLTSMTYPDGTYTTYQWDKLDLVGTQDRLGNWTSYGFNAVRQLVAVTNANGAVTTYQYCGCGSPSTISRWDGVQWLTTQFSYDLAGQLTNATYPDGYQLSYTYDALERLTNVVDNGGHAVELNYNDYDQITAIKVGSSGNPPYWALREFDEYGRLTNNIDRNGVITTNSYDYLDRMLTRRVIGALGDQSSGLESFAYTVRGLTNYTDALGKLTRFVRDQLGRTFYQTNANQEVLGFTYNPSDQLLALTDGKQQTNRWAYDAEGRVTNKVDAASAEMFRYQYDPAGRLTNRWEAGGISTTFGYDAVGNLTNVSYPNTPSLQYSYDPLNRLTNLVDGIGSTVFGLTDGNQLASEDGPWASDTVSYGYSSRLRSSLSVQQPNASAWAQSYRYDEYWRLTNVTSPAGVFGTQYKSVSVGSTAMLADLVSRLDLPGGGYIENTQDDLGRLLSTVLKNAQGTATNSDSYEYNGGHQRTKQTFTAGNYVDYSYDDIGQLKTAKGKEADATTRLHEQFGYAYDAAWNLNYRTNNGLTQTFGVNTLNELTTLSRSGTLTVAGAVCTTPRSVTVKDNGNSPVSATVYGDNAFARDNVTLLNGTNVFTAIAQDSYGRNDTNTVTVNLPSSATCYYDARGNLTNDGNRVFFYDDENQLTSVTVSNAWRSEFAYDGLLRRRIRKEFKWSGSTWSLTNEVRYVYDGRLVVQERDGNNLALVTYTRGNDLSGTRQGAGGIGGLLARTDNSLLLASGPAAPHAYYHADGNGNVTALVSTNQLVVARYTYDPYGNTLAASGPLAEANLYRFSSKEYHPNSGLVYYLYRYCEPNLQRWPNRDPLGDIGSLPIITARITLIGASDANGDTSEEEFLAGWTDVNRNLFGAIGNSPLNLFDPFGLSQCHIWDIHDEKDPDPILADINKRLNEQADERNAKRIEDDNKLKREVAKVAGLAAASEALGAEMAARAAAAKFLPRASQQLFEKGGWLNSNRYLRIGFSRDGGRKVFRIAGNWIGKIKKDPHIVIKDCGPL